MEFPIQYTPPEGTYDLPFIWVYNGTGLTNGQDAPNQFVYIIGGWGDFYLRRVVGAGSVLAPGVGTFKMYDRQRNAVQSEPKFCTVNTDDSMMVPQLEYKETEVIRFDLTGVQILTQ